MRKKAIICMILVQVLFVLILGWKGLLFAPIAILLIMVIPFGNNQKWINHDVNHGQFHKAIYTDIKRQASKKIEGESRTRVLNESLKIINQTNNILTLNSRFDVVCEHIEWFNMLGFQLNGKDSLLAVSETNAFVNDNITRIARYLYEKTISEVNTLKTKSAKENRIVKLFEQLELCKSSIKNNPNIEQCLNEIQDIHYKTEELYSEINSK